MRKFFVSQWNCLIMAAMFFALGQMQRRERVFRVRTDSLDHLTDREVVERYRLSKEAIHYLVDLIEEDICPLSNRSKAICALTKTLVTLRFYAKGDFFSEAADLHGLSKSSVSRCVAAVTNAINKRLKNIVFPTDRDSLVSTKRNFYNIGRIPNVVGAVDGSLFPIIAPAGADEAVYVCPKGYHALNIQAVVNTDMRFTDVVAKWPGSQHDSTVFDSSSLKRFLEDGETGWLLGDSGYPLRNYLITPKSHPVTESEVRFNNAHSRSRMVVERAFGILKSRFRCLHRSGGVLPFNPDKCAKVVVACMRLHNLCLDLGIPEPELLIDDEPDNDDNVWPRNHNASGNHIREHLISLF